MLLRQPLLLSKFGEQLDVFLVFLIVVESFFEGLFPIEFEHLGFHWLEKKVLSVSLSYRD